jgi:hypothetical protein
MAWTLCSKEDVTDMHPIMVGDLKDSWSDMAEGLIRQYLNAPYLGTSQQIVDEWHDGDGTNLLFVKHGPIISVESLVVDNAILTADEYVVFPTYIELKARVFLRGPLTVKVSYTSGTSDIPQPVRLAAVSMVVAMINYRRRSGADGSVKWGVTQKAVGEETPNQEVGITTHLTEIMRQTLKRNTLRVI